MSVSVYVFQSPTVILSPSCAASDRGKLHGFVSDVLDVGQCSHYGYCLVISVSCTMWESSDVKKADLSVLDISSAIIGRVESMPENMDYFYVGKLFNTLCITDLHG